MRRWSKALSIALGFALVLGTALRCGTPIYASSLTNESIREKEAEIDRAKEEKKALQSGLTNVQALKKELEASKAELAGYVQELDANLTKIQAKIDELKSMITQKEEQIDEKSLELEAALEEQRQQYEAMKTRIKFMYEKGEAMYLELFLGSESFGDMLNKAEYIEKLSSYDRKKLDEYVSYAEYVALCREGLEEEKEVLEEARRAVEEEEASLNALIAEKEQEIYKVSSDIQSKEEAIREYEAEIASQNNTIKALEAAVAEERKRLAEEQRRKYDGGVFAFPLASYTRISEQYGNRIHPILNVPQFHNGVDIAAPGGTAIYAAYNGKVVAADYNSSMGNYVMIDHGDSLYTIYMHASALYVSKGAEVTKGQKIAAVGSTGRSTGNHLHFSVRLNGSYVSPWNYIG